MLAFCAVHEISGLEHPSRPTNRPIKNLLSVPHHAFFNVQLVQANLSRAFP
jgi:hypothetical protein